MTDTSVYTAYMFHSYINLNEIDHLILRIYTNYLNLWTNHYTNSFIFLRCITVLKLTLILEAVTNSNSVHNVSR